MYALPPKADINQPRGIARLGPTVDRHAHRSRCAAQRTLGWAGSTGGSGLAGDLADPPMHLMMRSTKQSTSSNNATIHNIVGSNIVGSIGALCLRHARSQPTDPICRVLYDAMMKIGRHRDTRMRALNEAEAVRFPKLEPF